MKQEVFLDIELKKKRNEFIRRFGDTQESRDFLGHVSDFALNPAIKMDFGNNPEEKQGVALLAEVSKDMELVSLLSGDKNAPAMFQIVFLTLLLSESASGVGAGEDARNMTDLGLIDWNRRDLLKKIRENLAQVMAYLLLLKTLGVELGEETGRGFGDLTNGKFRPSKFSSTKAYIEYLRKKPELQELAKIIGRHGDNTESGKGKNPAVAYDGIHYSDDIRSMLASELLLHKNPALRLEFYRRYSERKLQCFRPSPAGVKADRKKEKGAVIACLDTSGSMRGSPEKIAKAVTLAMVQVAAEEKRPLYIISFSVGFESICIKDPSAVGELLRIESFLEMSFNGGTDISPAFERACEVLTEDTFRNADVLLISDFCAPPLSEDAKTLMESSKIGGTIFYALEIGVSGDEGILDLMDCHWRYSQGLEKLR